MALARLLVCARPLWLLDEPTAALDLASQNLLAGLMTGHRADGGLVIAATHQALGLEAAQTLHIEPGAGAPSADPAEGLGVIRAILALVGRDLRLAGRVGGSGALSLVFS